MIRASLALTTHHPPLQPLSTLPSWDLITHGRPPPSDP